VQRAELPETVQDVLKTKYNITLPEIETPDFLQNLTIFGTSGNDTARRGIMARQRGLRPKHPIVIIPGAPPQRAGVYSDSMRTPLTDCFRHDALAASIQLFIWIESPSYSPARGVIVCHDNLCTYRTHRNA
jgi:hypothetical protein